MKVFIFLIIIIFTLSGCENEQERKEKEHIAYQLLISGYSLDPQWFKKRIKQELKNEESFKRGSFFGVLLLCTPTTRALSLALLFFPAFFYVAIKKFGYGKGFSIAALIPYGWFIFSQIINESLKLALFAVFGEDYYFTYPFILFCTVSVSLLLFMVYSIKPLWGIITRGLILNRLLGTIGLVLEMIGTIFTLRDIFGLIMSI
ncbi:MAG: hypothetical protein HOP34_13375 [Methylococcaceae bacterium]|nr:hypothetical protein [Methylococcaceae bacterium]